MRGKYATKAVIRREANEADASEAAYRRQIVRLTQERDAARQERDAARVEWKREVRILTAQLSEAASPRVDALSRELEKFRERCDRLERDLKEQMTRRSNFADRLSDHFTTEHGLSTADAWQEMVYLAFGPDTKLVEANERKVYEQYGEEGVRRLRANKPFADAFVSPLRQREGRRGRAKG